MQHSDPQYEFSYRSIWWTSNVSAPTVFIVISNAKKVTFLGLTSPIDIKQCFIKQKTTLINDDSTITTTITIDKGTSIVQKKKTKYKYVIVSIIYSLYIYFLSSFYCCVDILISKTVFFALYSCRQEKLRNRMFKIPWNPWELKIGESNFWS